MENLLRLKRELDACQATLNEILGGPAPAARAREVTPGLRTILKGDKTFVVPENQNWFFETCHILKVHPKADEKDADAMESLPSGLRKYGSLTEGQWRLFKAIHYKLMGSWPEPPVDAAKAPVTTMTDAELDLVPF